MIGRRAFITLLGSAAAWPLAARARHPPVRASTEWLRICERKNIVIERRYALGQLDRLAYRPESGPGNGFGQ
jgi:hypothetical protein